MGEELWRKIREEEGKKDERGRRKRWEGGEGGREGKEGKEGREEEGTQYIAGSHSTCKYQTGHWRSNRSNPERLGRL